MKLNDLFEKQLLDDLEREYPNAALVAFTDDTPPAKVVNFLVTDIPGNLTNTHRAYNTATTLSAAINKYHSFIKGTA